MQTYEWYQMLNKPSFAPPASVFGLVWTFLYLIIIVSFGYVFYQAVKGKLPAKILIPFILNLIFNLSFTYIQFGLKNNFLAAGDVLLTLGTLIWIIFIIYPRIKWVAYAQIPYLLWVSFAAVLQLSITYLNS